MCEWCGIVDASAIAERLGVKVSTVHQWRQRDLGFPEPFTTLKIGPVWEWETVQVWAYKHGRTDQMPHNATVDPTDEYLRF